MEKYDEMSPRVNKNFEKKLPSDLVNAVNEDIYGDFRIQCVCSGIQPRSMVSKKFFNWLWNKEAYGILAELTATIEKKGSVKGNLNTLLLSVFKRIYAWDIPTEKIEKILTVYKREVKYAEKNISKLISQSNLVNRVYYGHYQGDAREYVYEMFERVFPGMNLFPNPNGSWTDPRDGKTYKTRRVFDTEYVTTPIGDPIAFGKFNLDIIPSGWRLPVEDEVRTAIHDGALDLKQIMTKERFCIHVKESEDECEHDSVFIPIEVERYVTDNYSEHDYIGVGDLHINYPGNTPGIYETRQKKSRKVSVMICRDVK